ncbi:MAG: hypothetical protein U0704_12190 [Candidatus Eisenbacteria bacterium]
MPAEPIAAEDLELLGKLARRVAELRMETPAILALESARPLSLVAGQALVFFEPFVQALFRVGEYRRYAALLERREGIEALVQCIERAVDERRGGAHA